MPAITTSVTLASSISLCLRCLAQRIHELGPNPLFQMLCEMSTAAGAMDRFERYGALGLHADFIEAYGGRDLPPAVWRVK